MRTLLAGKKNTSQKDPNFPILKSQEYTNSKWPQTIIVFNYRFQAPEKQLISLSLLNRANIYVFSRKALNRTTYEQLFRRQMSLKIVKLCVASTTSCKNFLDQDLLQFKPRIKCYRKMTLMNLTAF